MKHLVMSMWYILKLETIIFVKCVTRVKSDRFGLLYLSTQITIRRLKNMSGQSTMWIRAVQLHTLYDDLEQNDDGNRTSRSVMRRERFERGIVSIPRENTACNWVSARLRIFISFRWKWQVWGSVSAVVCSNHILACLFLFNWLYNKCFVSYCTANYFVKLR